MSLSKSALEDLNRNLSPVDPVYGEEHAAFHVLLTDSDGFHSCFINAASFLECEDVIRRRFPSATYWEIGVND